jgi:ketosteroid isomerase-like protein
MHDMSKTIEERLQVLEDREDLIKLKARYVNYNDGGWQGPTHTDPDAVADMFVEDGIWDGSPNAGYAKGHDEIRALFEQFRAVKFIIHYVTNPLIEIHGDTATGHWHALVTSTMPGDVALWILGLYKEQYVRTARGWKIKVLRFETAVTAPYEVGWGKAMLQAAAASSV